MNQEIIEVIDSEQDETSQNWCNLSEAGSLKEGYDLERFVEPPRKDFICLICLGVVRNPLECSQCGILLCKKCAYGCSKPQNPFFSMSSITIKFNCPICRSRAAPREPSMILKKFISNLIVYCKNKDRGCKVCRSIGEIKNHEKECDFKVIRCANHGLCSKEGSKIDFITAKCIKSEKNADRKLKFVCSEICRKVVVMSYLLKADKSEEAVDQYKLALEQLSQIN
ncbi:hypothetical protein SteCoe_14732 [Stentor coeruleus]|uniref:RING-type domain-containing protein n=1 Tax=Stentor coeruleus TaxID=5963 RepID=A0A1R2C5C1_9CILI|nr:hypothetical protein SteCoe_14732 [Stentor coeruleus]